MFVFTYTAAILSMFCFFLAAVILFKNWPSALARYLAYHVAAVGVWVGANAAADVARTPLSLIFWSGLAFIAVSFFISFYLCFIYIFIHKAAPPGRLFALYLLPAVIFSLGAFSKYSVVDTIFPANAPTQIIPGVLYQYHLAFFILVLIYSSWCLVKFYFKRATPRERVQTILMTAGFFLLFSGTIFFGIILPVYFNELRFFNAGPQFSLFLILATSFAILKYQLLDLKKIVQKSIIYSLLLGIIVAFYLGVLLLILFLTKSKFDDNFSDLIGALITTLTGIYTIPKLKNYFQRLTDPIFFKDTYDYGHAVDELTRVVNRNLSLNDLMSQVSDSLKKIFKSKNTALALFPRQIPALDNYPVRLPLNLGDKPLGILALDEKKSGERFSKRDLNLLKTFSYQYAVALEKARLFEEVREYSQHLEEKVRERTAAIKNLQENQAQMIVDISHNLQTPLTVIKGEISSLNSSFGGHKSLEALDKSIDRVSYLINRMLKLGRLAATEKIEKEKISLSSILEDIYSYISLLAEAKKIKVEAAIEKDLWILGNKNQLEEIVINLISNSIKYIANERKIFLKACRQADKIMIQVTDTGIGIPEKEIGDVFKSFYRSSNSRGIPGSGLGLAICKKIIELHDGQVKINSRVGQGTCVKVLLPTNC